MAYIGTVEYDQGGRIQSLNGLSAVRYDDGAKRNLVGWNLGAIKYDDGGRFRTLVGLGQDDTVDMPPPDVGIDTSVISQFPISYTPPSIAPTYVPYVPSPVVDTTPTQSAGTLVDTTPAATAPPVSVLTSIFSGLKNVVSSVAPLVQPKAAGTVLPLPGQPGYVAPAATASWFSQPSALGVPNWGLLAGAGMGVVVLMSVMGRSSSSIGSRKRNPGRPSRLRASRRNPAELILMGANPYRGRAR